jgi:hypothetical protein
MNKIFFPIHFAPKTTVFLLLVFSGFIFSLPAFSGDHTVSSKAVASPRNYSNCAEIQRDLNSKSTKHRFQGFEKVEMYIDRPMIRYYSKYGTALYCNGGSILTRYEDGTKRICNGYIMYLSQGDAIDYQYAETHYWDWGVYSYGAKYDEKKYCRKNG